MHNASMRVTVLKLLSVVPLAFLFVACTQEIRSYPSLVNQGILPLSTTNPYLGANLFLGNEAENSRYLMHFLEHRGAPSAIEITQQSLSTAHMILYYPRDREAYAADLQQYRRPDNAIKSEWVVRGPYPIERQDFRVLTQLDGSLIGEPIFYINGKQHRFRFEPPPDKRLKPPLPEYVPAPKPTPRPVKRAPKVVVSKSDKPEAGPTPVKPEVPQNFKNLSSDQMALLHAQGYALRDKSGDVLHVVKSDKESLQSIVKWYTGGESGVSEVAAANGLKPEEPLSIGLKVRIPEGLVKEPKRMP